MTFAEHEAFKPWTCIRCGHEIENKEEAHEHRLVNFFGPNKCRKIWGRLGMQKTRTGTRPMRRIRDIDKLGSVEAIRQERKDWSLEDGMVTQVVRGEAKQVRVWRVQRRD